ncbi:hypothetical protein JTB14_025219 [Gonioctena quinquepunctata]|nr:hypothetical protein JTB14_025219 [Gonioctena quinquepunctata]
MQWTCMAVLVNKSDQEIQLALTEPTDASAIDLDEYHIYTADIQPTKGENIEVRNCIRTDHMNNEEKHHILKLCRDFSGILHQPNTSLTFTNQKVMDHVLKGLQGHLCLVYMDDIIIFSTSLQEHIINIKKVFQRLQETNLKIQLDKSEFLEGEVAFFGHIITLEGIRQNPDKIKAIKKVSNSTNNQRNKGIPWTLGLL